MSIIFELIHSLFVALVFEFTIYVTGAVILRVVSFGVLKIPIPSFVEFKELKKNSTKRYLTPSILGFLFYVLLIAGIAWFN